MRSVNIKCLCFKLNILYIASLGSLATSFLVAAELITYSDVSETDAATSTY